MDRPRRTRPAPCSPTCTSIMDYATLVAELPPGICPAFDGMVIDLRRTSHERASRRHPAGLSGHRLWLCCRPARLFRRSARRWRDALCAELRGAGACCFASIATLDLAAAFDPGLLLSVLHRRVFAALHLAIFGAHLVFRPRRCRFRRHRLCLHLFQLAASGPADHRTRLWGGGAGGQLSPSSRSTRR